IPALRASLERELNDTKVQGLLVSYTHFYGSYWTCACSFGWYQKEVRVVRRRGRFPHRQQRKAARKGVGRALFSLRPRAASGHGAPQAEKPVRLVAYGHRSGKHL